MSMRMDENEVRAIIARIHKVTGRNPVAAVVGGGKPVRKLDTPIPTAGAPKKRVGRSGIQELEHLFASQLLVLEIAPPQREYRFMPNRDFRLDYAWPEKKLAVEVNGMVHRIKERFLRDTEKVAYALIHGWIVLPISGDDVRSGRGVSWLVTLWEQR
jgi:hypothetical protein